LSKKLYKLIIEISFLIKQSIILTNVHHTICTKTIIKIVQIKNVHHIIKIYIVNSYFWHTIVNSLKSAKNNIQYNFLFVSYFYTALLFFTPYLVMSSYLFLHRPLPPKPSIPFKERQHQIQLLKPHIMIC
jgi:hypothetical protein